jgi:leader peptidase (prepilin peptidase)/N-methyltransferase
MIALRLFALLASGLIWGSFLTVVKARVDNPKSIIFGRSKCPNCGKTLSWIELFPLLSYIFLGGKCRHCQKKISFSYPAIEVLSLFLAFLVYYLQGVNVGSVFLFISLSFLLIASVEDIERQEVDLMFFVLGILFALLYVALGGNIWMGVLGGITTPIIPFALYAISREKWMGLGDSLFAFWTGLIIGYPNSVAMLFLAFLIGSLFGIIKLALKTKKREVAFGPFLAISCVLSLIYAGTLLNYYMNFVGY